MPASGEDVGQQNEVRLMLCSFRELERVEVCEGHADVLRLAALIRSHCDIAIRTTCKSRVDSGGRQRIKNTALDGRILGSSPSAKRSPSLFAVLTAPICDLDAR
jgi:hypothetical protein